MPPPAPACAHPETVAECHLVIDTLAARNAELQRRVAELGELMAVLAERVALSSRNSSKPPSSDGPGRPNRAERRASARSRGAQKGHVGSFRALLDENQVDAIHECPPPPVCPCGATVVAQGKPIRHQVFDLPAQVRAEVNEYRLYHGVCQGCGEVHRAVLPAGVPRGQLGPRSLALVGTLATHYHLTQFKIRDLLARLMGVDFCVGTISAAHGKLAQALRAPVQEAQQSLGNAAVVHVDETPYPREGSANWAWAAVTPTLAVYNVLPSRARYVFTSLLGEQPAALVVSDRYSAYAHLDVQRRQVCWAHLLRDFRRIAERPGEAGRIGRRLLGLGYLVFRWRERGELAAGFERLKRRVKAALERATAQTRCRRTAATCANVLKLWESLWQFVGRADVAPTNNAAEQALRSVVLKRKISGPTRSRRGDEFIAHGYTAMMSCQRQGRDLLSYLHHAVLAWIDKTAPPSLLPAGSIQPA
jgi:transposase